MKKKTPGSFPDTGDLSTETKTERAPATVRVAHYKGPPCIVFYGREWHIGQAQTIPLADWVEMNKRPDISGFDYREEY